MYGILITLGVISALLISERIARNKNLDLDIFWQSSFWTILFGVIGARLYHVIDFWEVYSKNLMAAVTVWHGGVGIFGALAGGFLAFFIYLKRKDQDIRPWLDVITVPLPLAQAIGRWGNYFNSELLPYALYESAADFLLFLGLVILNRKNNTPGIVFIAYLIGYSSIRLFLEPIRIDSWTIGTLNVAQGISILLLIISIYLLNKWKRKR